MAEIARGDVELLVHTTAPSRGHDDARYRALAQAYLDFQPSTRCRLYIEAQGRNENSSQGETNHQLCGELLQSTQNERESQASYQADEEDDSGTRQSSASSQYQQSSDRQSILDFPASSQLSFRSVLDNADSPVFRARTLHQERIPVPASDRHLQSSAESCRAAPSTIADSQPDYDPSLLAFSSPSRVLETYLQYQTRFDNSSPVLPTHRPDNTIISSGASIRLNEIEVSEDTGFPSSPSPQKKSLQEGRTQAEASTKKRLPTIRNSTLSLKRKQNESISDFDSSPILAPPDTSALISQPSADRLARLLKRQRVEPSKARLPAFTKVTKINMTTDFTSSLVSNTDSSNWSETLEIRPTPPQTSTGDLTAEMLITESLHQMMKKISSRGQYPYVPHSQTRDLRPMERGYWLVNCEEWETSIRTRCWEFLGKYVGRDLAGWGVSCIRDVGTQSIRVYCWGIVVEHIYLLLHMASASKVKGTGACWIGGDNTVIITMPS